MKRCLRVVGYLIAVWVITMTIYMVKIWKTPDIHQKVSKVSR